MGDSTTTLLLAAVLGLLGLTLAVLARRGRSGASQQQPIAPPPAQSIPPPESATPAPAPRAAPGGDGASWAPVRITYEEDADVDPTKVGADLRGPRLVLQPPTSSIVFDEDAGVDEPTHAGAIILVSASAQTDRGLKRKRNEDSLLALDEHALYVVADGMGGYHGGDVASALAVNTMADAFEKNDFEGKPHANLPRRASELARAVQMANIAVFTTAANDPSLRGMGTTICAARFSPDKQRVYLAHVGDSRCYRFRDGSLTQMTADHTMRELGVQGPQSAHLSRAVGIWETVTIDVIIAKPLVGDVYLLCSDGLTKMMSNGDIEATLSAEPEPASAVERLVREANERGGKDNVTVILVRVNNPALLDAGVR